jgi:hypothetical protein
LLRKDNSGRFVKSGFIFPTYRYTSGSYQMEKAISCFQYKKILKTQEEEPCLLMTDEERNKKWWMFKGEYYWENDGLNELEVKALAVEKLARKERKINRALSAMENHYYDRVQHTREHIADDVKMFVWNRDGGRCVKCGSNENLEFDHIIPVSKGGSNTARNIQILCEACNRSKGDSIV